MKDLCIHLPMTLMRKICSNCAHLLKSTGRTPPICRFPQICHCRFTEICWQKFPSPVCRFPQICHCRFTEMCWQNSPQFPDFLKSAGRNPPQFADFHKSATADLLKCAGRNPSSLQISTNLPLQIY